MGLGKTIQAIAACALLHRLGKVQRVLVVTPASLKTEREGMLELVRGLCERIDLGYAWHTGSVPQRRRRAEINAFKSDPACRVFLSTDSGGAAAHALQDASRWSRPARTPSDG